MNKTFTTAKGIAYYPYISAPDTKFDEQGHYKVNLCLSEEDAQPVIEVIKQTVVEGIKALKKDHKSITFLPFNLHIQVSRPPGSGSTFWRKISGYRCRVYKTPPQQPGPSPSILEAPGRRRRKRPGVPRYTRRP